MTVSVTGLNVPGKRHALRGLVWISTRNPTREPIQLEEFDYLVVVESGGEQTRWSGRCPHCELPAGKTVSMSIPAVVSHSPTPGRPVARNLLQRPFFDTLRYRFAGLDTSSGGKGRSHHRSVEGAD